MWDTLATLCTIFTVLAALGLAAAAILAPAILATKANAR